MAQEFMHTMKSKKGKKGFIVFKVDLEKVYDRLDWSFLKDNLEDLGFKNHFMDLSLNCVLACVMQVV